MPRMLYIAVYCWMCVCVCLHICMYFSKYMISWIMNGSMKITKRPTCLWCSFYHMERMNISLH